MQVEVESDFDAKLDRLFFNGKRLSDLMWELAYHIDSVGLAGVPQRYRMKQIYKNHQRTVYEFTITSEEDGRRVLASLEADGTMVFGNLVNHRDIDLGAKNMLKSSEVLISRPTLLQYNPNDFKPIPGAEHRYHISRDGQVYDVIKGRTLNSVGTSSGHLKVVLTLKDGSRIFPSVHRLVALTYIPNPRKLPIVNHKNGIKTDNRVENLEWASGSFNNMHANRYGLSYFRPRVDNSSGYVGISKNPRGGYIAYINSAGKRIHGGTFEFLGDAIDARERLKQKYHLTDDYLKQP